MLNSTYKIGIKFIKHIYFGNLYKILNLKTNKTYYIYQSDNLTNKDLKDLFKRYDHGDFNNNRFDLMKINLKANEKYTLTHNDLVLKNKLSNIEINGNGATIKKVPDDNFYDLIDKVYSNYLITNYQKLYINNLNFKNFKNCIENHGYLKLYNVNFDSNNRAIYNYGKVSSINSTFRNNNETKGASIYNEKEAYAEFLNCNFTNKKSVNEIYCNDLSYTKVIITNETLYKKPSYKCSDEGLIVFRNSTVPIVHIENVTTNNTINSINEYEKYDIVVLNFKNQTYCYNNFQFGGLVEKIIINGNGATFKGYHKKNINILPYITINHNNALDNLTEDNYNLNDKVHFAVVNLNHQLTITNATLKYFNIAIVNYGVFKGENVIFDNNRVNWNFYKDFAGAIFNRENGEIECINCTFINNYGKYAGAIYNDEKALAIIINCIFKNNTQYNNTLVDIYNMNSESLQISIINSTNTTEPIIVNYKGLTKIQYLTISVTIPLVMGLLIPYASTFIGELMLILEGTVADIIGTVAISSVSSAIISSINGVINHDLSLDEVLTSSIIGGCLSVIDLQLNSAVVSEIGYEVVISKFGNDWNEDNDLDMYEIIINGAINGAL